MAVLLHGVLVCLRAAAPAVNGRHTSLHHLGLEGTRCHGAVEATILCRRVPGGGLFFADKLSSPAQVVPPWTFKLIVLGVYFHVQSMDGRRYAIGPRKDDPLQHPLSRPSCQ